MAFAWVCGVYDCLARVERQDRNCKILTGEDMQKIQDACGSGMVSDLFSHWVLETYHMISATL